MSQRVPLAMLSLLAAALPAPAQSLPATIDVVQAADAKRQTIIVKHVTQAFWETTRDVQVQKNGQIELQKVTGKVPFLREQYVVIPVKDLKAYTGDGKALEEKELWKRLKAGAVVVRGDQRLLQPGFVKAFRPEAVLLISRTPPMPVLDPPPRKVDE